MKSKGSPIINEQFWDALFFNGTMPWDRNQTPNELKHYLKRIADKTHSVFIPGCGAAYEVSHFVDCGHDVIAMDYSAEAANLAKSQLGQYQDKVMLGDVFSADFSRAFDVIYERAFLAALPREMWPDYFAMVDKLLPRDGLLIGYFVIDDDYRSRFPPFCLRSGELAQHFEPTFTLIESSPVTNSVDVFKGKEYWMVWQKC
ncbi:TPA: methyltransferase domain-containing protein [Vibrio parahaemolyticus]|uniref:methyltransferase domain-containing protein n=1 Tax=Vibrio parahaemolyticus TaxID=670 RepID=UPI00111E5273|nr:methyltransferase domain-containing protein [Vibrio parahaemolyticus]MBE4436661.1 methyltransferase domain-containing protein [Vibrio parahaemolyticus]MCR9881359.1 TPMT family class I SAM-dependent methyltransferase [Vibrio parahaemolyticus]MCR9896175.1 TPMT family class I SAM-dependent methyltransferase [Vibrio parahaemolyticus]MCR9956602.1 TPMT family class I SAM-dependent methyltransferase [Vibrio parahaemolyticus]MDF5057044.1 methyltransferase domain-containing protein [Vibrio parahaemo